MRAKQLLAAAVIATLPFTAHAAWFCGDDIDEFAIKRTANTMYDVFIDSGGVIMMDSNQAAAKERVDNYLAKVAEMDAWANALSDGCLRGSYKNALATHRRIIERALRAIEFMKTPQPFAPNS